MPDTPPKKPSESEHDKTLKDTFPASDPPASSGIAGPESDKHPEPKKP